MRMKTFIRFADRGVANGPEKRTSLAELLRAASDGAGDGQHALAVGVSVDPIRN
jgi:hypothetical protein